MAACVLTSLDSITDGGLIEIQGRIEGAVESMILHRDGDHVRAWLNVCPHAGRRLDWAPGKFLRSKEGLLVCAVHGASFELIQGECVAGPCRGDRLREVAVEVEGRNVILRPERFALDVDPKNA
jgi:nitrite reductase/ring-hydroxylating ferredoxin subunit